MWQRWRVEQHPPHAQLSWLVTTALIDSRKIFLSLHLRGFQSRAWMTSQNSKIISCNLEITFRFLFREFENGEHIFWMTMLQIWTDPISRGGENSFEKLTKMFILCPASARGTKFVVCTLFPWCQEVSLRLGEWTLLCSPDIKCCVFARVIIILLIHKCIFGHGHKDDCGGIFARHR